MGTIYVIDIGSNSVRLAKIEDGKTVYKLTDTTQVSENLSKSGYLGAEGMERTLSAVKRFCAAAREEGGITPLVFATQAFRKALNGREFADRIGIECGCNVDIISGELEAYLGYIGAGGLSKDTLTIIDIGGASTEIVIGKGKDIIYKKSIEIGAVSLKDTCGRERTALEHCISDKIEGYGDIFPLGSVTGIGGTATSLAAIDLNLSFYDPNLVHGHSIPIGRLKEICDMLLGMSIEEIMLIPCMPKKRAEVISGGALLLLRICEKLGASELFISEGDNLEGYAMLNEAAR